MNTRIIVITGSSSGIGFGLAESFLQLGCSVTITGRSENKVNRAVNELTAKYRSERIFSFVCDVTDFSQLQKLWDVAKAHFGRIDIWINNAGVAHGEKEIWNYEPKEVDEVIQTNVTGTIYGTTIAMKGMVEQGFGSIYNLEGLGSDGRVIKGMTLYGTTKSAVSYLTKALAKEAQGTSIIVGGIRPGMTATKLITAQYEGHPEEWDRVKRIFNILSDRVETVTPWIAKKILSNTKNGVTIVWLNRWKLMGRFVTAPFHKRNVFE